MLPLLGPLRVPLSVRILITFGISIPLKAGFDATILCKVSVTSSAFMFLTLFKNSVVMLFSYAVSKEPLEEFWGSSSLAGKNSLADE